jgi:16S rRNA U1498 N3-methylase RsmE
MIDITPIVNAIIALVAALITTFFIPWIKGKIDAQKLSQIERWVEIAVGAAEQIYKESGMGEKKKQYVLDFLAKKGLKLDLDSLDALIEEAVFNIQ